VLIFIFFVKQRPGFFPDTNKKAMVFVQHAYYKESTNFLL